MKRLISIFLVYLICLYSQALAVNLESLKVGDIVKYGSYEQDNIIDNGKEAIEWIVLDIVDNKALLISKYCIDTVIFYPQRVLMYWKKSDLRAWLNGDFLKETFSKEEQAKILLTVNKNANPHGMSGVGDDTEDRVFLLSKDETAHYFPNQADRLAYPTEFAKSKNCTIDTKTGACRWWTRTMGARPMDVCGVRVDGRFSAYGMQDVDWPTNTMRPAIWINIK